MKQLRPKELKGFFKNNFKHKLNISLLLDNLSYARNVAEIFRIADSAKVNKIYLYGHTKTPPFGKDLQKVSRKKEMRLQWEEININDFMRIKDKFLVIGLEITNESISLFDLNNKNINNNNVLIICGNEVNGISKTLLKYTDLSVFIPMYGKGSSMNVSVSTAILLFKLIEKYGKEN